MYFTYAMSLAVWLRCFILMMIPLSSDWEGSFLLIASFLWLSCSPEGTHGLAIEPVGVFVKIADVVWWWRTLVSLRQHQYINRCSLKKAEFSGICVCVCGRRAPKLGDIRTNTTHTHWDPISSLPSSSRLCVGDCLSQGHTRYWKTQCSSLL